VEFDFWQGRDFTLLICVYTSCRASQSPMQWLLGIHSMCVKQLGSEADLSPPRMLRALSCLHDIA
jgi:hypothetical protein